MTHTPTDSAFRCPRCGQFHVDPREPCYRPDPEIARRGIAECRTRLAEVLAELRSRPKDAR